MRVATIDKDFWSTIYNKINTIYPNIVNLEYFDDVPNKERTLPYITLRTSVDYTNSGIKVIKKREGRIKIICYADDFEETLDMKTAVNTAIESIDELYLSAVRGDNDKLKIDADGIYWQSLDFETNIHINNKAP